MMFYIPTHIDVYIYMYERIVFSLLASIVPSLFSSGLVWNVICFLIAPKNGDVFAAAFPTTIPMRNTAQWGVFSSINVMSGSGLNSQLVNTVKYYCCSNGSTSQFIAGISLVKDLN